MRCQFLWIQQVRGSSASTASSGPPAGKQREPCKRVSRCSQGVNDNVTEGWGKADDYVREQGVVVVEENGWSSSTDDIWKVLIHGNPEVVQEMALNKSYSTYRHYAVGCATYFLYMTSVTLLLHYMLEQLRLDMERLLGARNNGRWNSAQIIPDMDRLGFPFGYTDRRERLLKGPSNCWATMKALGVLKSICVSLMSAIKMTGGFLHFIWLFSQHEPAHYQFLKREKSARRKASSFCSRGDMYTLSVFHFSFFLSLFLFSTSHQHTLICEIVVYLGQGQAVLSTIGWMRQSAPCLS